MAEDRGRRLLDAGAVALAAIAAALLFTLLGLPSPALFGGLLAGLVRVLGFRRRVAVPAPALAAAQAVVGVSLGSLIDLATLRTVAANWLPVLLVTVGTLLLSLLAGLILRLQPGISPVTGAFALIAGGASGIIVMARELGADERMVAVLQYLRVLLIVVLMPVVAAGLYGASPGSGSGAGEGGPGWLAGLLFTVGCGVVGLVVGRRLRLPVAALLGPMVLAAVVDLSGLGHGAQVPAAIGVAAFLVIGLQVGVSFTRDSLATIGRALPLALTVILGLIVASAGLGAVLAAATGASALDGYLATTPGGLYAVLATATDSGADTTFVLAVQVLRLFVMLLSAPLVARVLRRSGGT
ncbi:MAG TPA: AbrB family transcriptional regulator [Blastococcus sp.]|nr:AbrB family transcriptional regulator [Blastococcus sp.]